MMLSRRGLLGWLGGGAALLAAPAIVRASSLMPVKAWREPVLIARGPGYTEAYIAGENIPFASAVRLGRDGRIYLCNDKDDFFGVSVSLGMTDTRQVLIRTTA